MPVSLQDLFADMKDLRLPAAVTIPAAIGLVGVLWLLRRKAGSGDGKKKTHKAVLEETEGASESNSLSDSFDEQPEKRQIEGIIDSPQKISESSVGDSSISGLRLESVCSPESSVCHVTLGFGKPSVGTYRNLNERHQRGDLTAEIKHSGQAENSVCQNGQVNSRVSADLIQSEQTDNLNASRFTSSDLGVAASDAQTSLGDGLMGVETCVGKNSALVDQVGDSYGLTERGQGDGTLPVGEMWDNVNGGLVSQEATQDVQGSGLVSAGTNQVLQGGSLASSDTTEDDQCSSLISDPVWVGHHGVQQRDQNTPSAVSEVQQEPEVQQASEVRQEDDLDDQSDIHKHDQSSPSVASEVLQASEALKTSEGRQASEILQSLEILQEESLDDQRDVNKHDQSSPSVVSEVLQASEVQQDNMHEQHNVQQYDQSTPSVASEVLQEDDIVASDAHLDDHYDSLISSNGQQDSLYESLWSSYGQVEGNSDSLMSSVVQQDDQFDSMMSSYNTPDSEFGSQISLEAAQPKAASITELDQGDRLTTSQKAYIEQQVMTAMGDGLEEACRQLRKTPVQSETSVKQMPVETAIADESSRRESGEVEHHVEKRGGSDLEDVLAVDRINEDDQDLTGPMDEETAGVESHTQIQEDLVQLQTEATVHMSLESHNTESVGSPNTEHLESPDSELLATISLESANTEILESADTGILESADTAILESGNTDILESSDTESLKSTETEAFVSGSDECLQTTALEASQLTNTTSVESAETESEELADYESFVSACDESLEPATANLGPPQSFNIEPLMSASSQISKPAIADQENANPAVSQEKVPSVQEALTTVKPCLESSLCAGYVPQVHTANGDLFENSPSRDLKQGEQCNSDVSKDSSSSATSRSDARTEDTSVKSTQDKSSSGETRVHSLPPETRKAFSWLPKASSSSVDSFGPEEIEALWGIESSMVNMDAELTFVDADPVAVSVGGAGGMDLNGGLGTQQDVPAAVSIASRDTIVVAACCGSTSDTSCDVSDPNVKDGAIGKSISPVCDNNSEGSNDSGRGGSEHDMVCQGGEVPVHFSFCMPSELCGQFIGKGGKNINYLKSRTGAHVTLTSNAFMPEFQICQIVGTQTEVDDALSMIRRKFPLQEYPHLTMDPVDMSVPLPMTPDNQVVYPEVMQLSLPEGVSVDVFVSAVVDAGQVFVQQPTHRSYMSLEKMNYFLNLVYSQDPTVPCVPLPIESGVICVCESEGYWYRAMIMSPVDENGEVQLKFVDYGGYIILPVTSLKQIRVDFMNLPFQAVECFMANITPNQGEKLFSDEATQALCDLTQGKLLQCQVVARTEYGIPYIHLYQVNPERNSAVLINRALVNRRLVRWIEIL